MNDVTPNNKSSNTSPSPAILLAQESKEATSHSLKNKDNFWNLMFVLGMVVGSLTIGIIWSLVIMVCVLKWFNNTSVRDNKLFNSQGNEIPLTQVPKVMHAIFAAIGATIFTNVFLATSGRHIGNDIIWIAMIIVGFSVFALFFIFNNCPISFIFTLKSFTLELPGEGHIYNAKHDSSTPSSSYVTDPKFSHLSNNIFNRDRFK